jgi:hypothetical protein
MILIFLKCIDLKIYASIKCTGDLQVAHVIKAIKLFFFPTLVSTRREWMPVELGSAAPSPYGGVLTAKSSSTDIHGNTTWQYTYTDAANAVRVGLVSTPDSTTDAVTTTVNGLTTEQTSRTGVTTESPTTRWAAARAPSRIGVVPTEVIVYQLGI